MKKQALIAGITLVLASSAMAGEGTYVGLQANGTKQEVTIKATNYNAYGSQSASKLGAPGLTVGTYLDSQFRVEGSYNLINNDDKTKLKHHQIGLAVLQGFDPFDSAFNPYVGVKADYNLVKQSEINLNEKFFTFAPVVGARYTFDSGIYFDARYAYNFGKKEVVKHVKSSIPGDQAEYDIGYKPFKSQITLGVGYNF